MFVDLCCDDVCMYGCMYVCMGGWHRYDSDISTEHETYAHQVTFLVSGVVCLTLTVNGSTTDLVYQKLNLYPLNPFRATIFHNVMRQLEADTLPREIEKLRRRDEFFARSNWKAVKQLIPNFTKSILVRGDLVTVDPERKGVLAILKALGLCLSMFVCYMFCFFSDQTNPIF